MVTVAKKRIDLKKRVDRFFDKENSERSALCDFLNELSMVARVYIFGGVVRDIALRGVRGFNSDIDVVIEAESRQFKAFINPFNPEENKFGGYRLRIDQWSVDVWEAEKTWAFTTGLKTYETIDSLLETTITNWDGVMYDWSNKKVIARENYVDQMVSGYLHITLPENPNEIGMLVRILRFCADPNLCTLSGGSIRVLRDCLTKYTFEDVSTYERNSFSNKMITKGLYSGLLDALKANSGDLLPVDLGRWHTTKQFSFDQ